MNIHIGSKMANLAKLSLVAQFDDICRYHTILGDFQTQDTSLEAEFLKFFKITQLGRKQWLQTEVAYNNLQVEYDTSTLELKEWKSKFDNLMRKYRDERNKRLEAEGRFIELKRVVCEVKEAVNKDNTINDQTKERFAQCVRYELPEPIHEVINEQSEFYDKTEDDLDFEDGDIRLGKRRSRSGGRNKSDVTPPKQRKSGDIYLSTGRENTLIATTTVTVPQKGDITATSKIIAQPQMERCNSEPEPFIFQGDTNTTAPPQITRHILRSDSECYPMDRPRFPSASSTSSFSRHGVPGTPTMTPSLTGTPLQKSNSSLQKRQYSGSRLIGRQHNFVSKTVIRPEKCNPCGRRIKFYKEALKCIDCKATCHPECQNRVGLPCVPCINTPTNRGERTTISDYAPNKAPMVPALLIFCVNEIESRGLSEVGLYRVSGSELAVKDWKERILKGKGTPNLAKIEVHVLCGVIKEFLRSFESLVPRALWLDFIKAADIEDSQDSQTALYQAISQLPQANRDSLAFLILHWQRIAATPEVKMDIRNLASILGPTVVGYSSAQLEAASIIAEQKKQVAVMNKLLHISSNYWSSFLNAEPEVFTSHLTTPESTPDTLGMSLRSGSYSSLSQVVSKTPLSSRTPTLRSSAKHKFFASPSLGSKP